MLHIVLLILKIVGIVLACLLGLVILILAALLFIPVTYRIDAHYHDNKIKAGIRASWIGIVRACVFHENELVIRVKAFFFTLYNNGDSGDKANLTEERDKTDLAGTADAVRSDSKFPDMDEAFTDAKDEQKAEQDSIIIDEKNEKKEFPIVRFVKTVADKIKHIYRLIVDTIHNVGNAADNLKRKYEEIRDMINDEDNRELVVFFIAQLKALLAHIRPKKYSCDVTFGLEDPSALGNALMYISVAYGLLGIDINLTPVFGEKVMEADVVMKGRIRIFTVIMIALKVYRNKQFKKFISR